MSSACECLKIFEPNEWKKQNTQDNVITFKVQSNSFKYFPN